MKGQGTTINSIILILLLIVVSVVIISVVFFSGNRQYFLNLREAELLKAKNEFALANRSLGMTWFISTAQAVFKAGDDSLGHEYWFRTDPSNPKQITLPTGECNNGNPRICLPQPEHAAAYLKNAMGPYLSVPNQFTAAGVALAVSEISLDHEKNFWPAYDRITAVITQKMDAAFGDTSVAARTSNDVSLPTQFRKLMTGGWRLVGAAMDMQAWRAFSVADTERSYLGDAQAALSAKTDAIAQWMEPVNAYFAGRAELIAPTAAEQGILEPQKGLLLRYEIAALFVDGVPATSFPGTPNFRPGQPGACMPSQYDAIIESAAGDWTFGPMSYSRQDVAALLKAIIQQESTWNPDAGCTPGGGCGLVQITQATADGDCAAEGGWDQVRRDTGSNIRCGATVLRKKFEAMYAFEKRNRDNLKKLALAAYNGGEGTVGNALRIAKTTSWDQVTQDSLVAAGATPAKARIMLEYVPGVLRCYGFYFYPVADNSYTWPTEARVITTPFSAGHPGLDIAGNPAATYTIYATYPGIAEKINTNCINGQVDCGNRGYGNYVIVRQDDGRYSLYGHLDVNGVFVREGDRVGKCTPLGRMGTTGHSTGNHLHFEIMKSLWGVRENPCTYVSCASRATQCTGASPVAASGAALPSSPTGYYRYDEAVKTFTKAPFQLGVKVADYVVALDCRTSGDQRFSWRTENDMICYGSWLNLCTDYASDGPRYISGLEQGNAKQQGDDLTGSGREYQCVSMCKPPDENQETCQPMFCEKHVDGINPDPKFRQCCTNWEWHDNGPLGQWKGRAERTDPITGDTVIDDQRCHGNTFCAGDSFTDTDKGEVCDVRNTADLGPGNAHWCDGPKLRKCRNDASVCSDDPSSRAALDRAYTTGVCAASCSAAQACDNVAPSSCGDADTLCDSQCAATQCPTSGCDAWHWACDGDDRIQKRNCRNGCGSGRCVDRSEQDDSSRERCDHGCDDGKCKQPCGDVCKTDPTGCSKPGQSCQWLWDTNSDCTCFCSDAPLVC